MVNTVKIIDYSRIFMNLIHVQWIYTSEVSDCMECSQASVCIGLDSLTFLPVMGPIFPWYLVNIMNIDILGPEYFCISIKFMYL